MASVELRGLTKHFDQVKAVDNVDLKISDGEFLVLLGPSGSGKTTLMRLCAGLEQPTAGRLFINGQVVNDVPPRERGIAMVFQSYALYPHKTVFKNISFPLTVEKLGKKEIKQKVEWAAGLLGIGHLLDRRPAQISGGEKQRVAIARALVNNPSIILADEPTGNLDSKTSYSIMELFQRLHHEGNTIIMVTHEDDIAHYANRIVKLRDGLIESDDINKNIYGSI